VTRVSGCRGCALYQNRYFSEDVGCYCIAQFQIGFDTHDITIRWTRVADLVGITWGADRGDLSQLGR
jgi:hypothetical protein